MAQITTINIRVNENIKNDVDALLDKLGLNINVFINMTLRQLIIDEALPFHPKSRRKRQSLNEYLEAYHNKDIESVLREAETSNEKPIEIDWGMPVGKEV